MPATSQRAKSKTGAIFGLLMRPLGKLRSVALLIIRWGFFQIIKKQGFTIYNIPNLVHTSNSDIYIANHESALEGLLTVSMVPYEFRLWVKPGIAKNIGTRLFFSRLVHSVDDPDLVKNSQRNIDRGIAYAAALEGTRSHGIGLRRAQSGIVGLAIKLRKVKILPIAYGGTPRVRSCIFEIFLPHRDFSVTLGEPFYIKKQDNFSVARQQAIADEMMCRIAELLPPEKHGYYRDMVGQPYRYTADWDEEWEPRGRGLERVYGD